MIAEWQKFDKLVEWLALGETDENYGPAGALY